MSAIISKKAALADLQSTVCACQAKKGRGKSHCGRCYFRLPKGMRDALYSGLGRGYEEAYTASLERLGFTSPAATLEAAA